MMLFKIAFRGNSSSFFVRNMSVGGRGRSFPYNYALNQSENIERALIVLLRDIYTEIPDSDPSRFYIAYTARDDRFSYYVAKPI